jgi:ketosteroid isomerase-like protein
MGIIQDEFLQEQQAINQRLTEILDAVQAKDFVRLAGYHLHSPKFTKYNDIAPMERQGIDESNRSEKDELGAVTNFNGTVPDLQIDVFGSVAIVTGALEYTFETDGEVGGSRIRMTLIFVDDRGEWKIAHEHLSPFQSSPN